MWKLLHNHSKPAVFLKKKFKVNQPTQSICSFYVKNFLDVWRTLKELRLQNLLICCDNLAMTKFFEKKKISKKIHMYTGRVNYIMDLLKTLFKKMDTHVL